MKIKLEIRTGQIEQKIGGQRPENNIEDRAALSAGMVQGATAEVKGIFGRSVTIERLYTGVKQLYLQVLRGIRMVRNVALDR